jgi:hypothetical protein
VFPFLITGGMSFLVLWQLPNMASGLAGGLSLTGHGVPGRILDIWPCPPQLCRVVPKVSKAQHLNLSWSIEKART